MRRRPLAPQTAPRGTSAFIGNNATLAAGRHVDLDARERVDVTMVGGGLGIGGSAIGAGIAVLTYDEQVQAFIGSGATLSAGTVDATGDVTVDARLRSDLSVLAVTGGFGTIAGLAAAVAVIDDRSNVSAYIEDGSSSGTGVKILRADSVNLTADHRAAIHTSTVGAAGGGFAALGAAVTIATVSGDTLAEIGDWTQIGSAAQRVNGVDVTATSTATVGPFGDAKTMAVGLAVSFIGAGAAGVAAVTIDSDTDAAIGSDAVLDANGEVKVEAISVATADVDADGGSIGAIAIGAMIARADIQAHATDSTRQARTRAQIGPRTSIQAGGLSVYAENTSDASADMVAAGGGIFAGRGGEGTTHVKPTIEAFLDDGVIVDISGAGNVSVEAKSLRAEANASAKSFGGGGIDIGIIFATAEASPTVKATIDADAEVTTAAGNVEVKATALSQPTSSTPLTDFFQPEDGNNDDVDTGADTIHFESHGLTTGDRVTYDPNGNTAISTPGGSSGTQSLGTLADGRLYNAIVVGSNNDTIKLGNTFDAAAGNTGDLFDPAIGVDAERDRIRFAIPHNFKTGDAVKYDPGTNTSLNGTVLNTTSTFYARALDDFTIKLFTSWAQATAAPSSFDPSASPNTVTADDYIHLSGFANGDAVTYYAPEPVRFSSLGVDSRYVQDSDPNTDGNQPALENEENNRIFLGRDTSNPSDGVIDTGHGFNTGNRVTYETDGTAIGGLANGGTYHVLVHDSNQIQLLRSYASLSGVSFNQIDDATDEITRSAGNWVDDGFVAGQEIVISGTANNNKTLTIQSVAGNKLFFAGDVLADETSAAVLRASTPIALTADKSTTGQRVHHALVREQLGVLENGKTFYVRDSDGSKFHLAETTAANAAVLDVDDTGRSGTHAFGRAGIELAGSSGVHELHIDLSTKPTGNHKLLGPDGVSLRQIALPAGDGQSSASTQGGSGGSAPSRSRPRR